jgi:hypothetical protein
MRDDKMYSLNFGHHQTCFRLLPLSALLLLTINANIHHGQILVEGQEPTP